MWVDQTGVLFVKDDTLPPPAPAGTPDAAPFPNNQTFTLHSRPGAQRVLFLDFDGQAVSGTAWNSSGISTDPQPAFDLDGSPQTWSQSEHDVVQSVYQRVAEDYAPFDLDVTTEDPGDDALHRTSAADQRFGTRVLISPSDDAVDKLCGSCGGVAYIGVYNYVGSAYYQPAWVFPQRLSNNAKYIAEAASHEAGHNLGLNHDGTPTVTYYAGHRNWAPIMGLGYHKPVVQWSRGEYAGANNTQDDLSVIQSHGLPLRSDDHGSTTSTAHVLGTATTASGVIGTRDDRDVFSINRQCSSDATITLIPAPSSPNLDGSLRVLDASGELVAQDDPLSGQQSNDVATGMSVQVVATLAAGHYFIEVDGVGVLDPETGYSDYGSLGSYSLNISACYSVPSIPSSFTVDKDDTTRSATISWQPPALDGGSVVTGYRVARDAGTVPGKSPWSKIVGPESRSQTFLNLTRGSTYTLTVEPINAVGNGPAASGQVTIAIPAKNLLKNPGFERDANLDSRPDSWTSKAKFSRSSKSKHLGSYSGRHRGKYNGKYAISQVVTALTGGVNYGFSGWVRVPATTDAFTFRIRVRWRNSANTVVRTEIVRRDSQATRGWKQFARTLTSPPRATNARIQMVATSLRATVYVDDFTFARD